MTFLEALMFEEILERFKEADKAKANERTNKKRGKSTDQSNNMGSPPKGNNNCKERQIGGK